MLSDYVALKQKVEEKTTDAGIIIPESVVAKTKVPRVTVVSVPDGSRLGLKAGDEVIYDKQFAVEVEVDGDRYQLVRENNIFCRIIHEANDSSK